MNQIKAKVSIIWTEKSYYSIRYFVFRSCYGGVGRNIADVLACLDSNPFFISAVGNDPLGHSILRHNEKLDKSGIDINEDPTSSYCVVLDFKGQARIGIGDIKQVRPMVDSCWKSRVVLLRVFLV